MEFLNVLSREEMRNIKGGDPCGNVYCMIGGEQTWQGSGCGAMDQALSNCIFEEEFGFGDCGGCAQFPIID